MDNLSIELKAISIDGEIWKPPSLPISIDAKYRELLKYL